MTKFLSLALCISALFLMSGCKNTELAPFTSFSFSETGSVMNSGFSYQAITEAGVTTVTIQKDGMAEEDALTAATDAALMEQLYAIAEKYEMGRWNGFDKSSKSAMDGRSFRLTIYMDNGSSIKAKGFMKWPENYSEAAAEITALFDSIYDAASPTA